MAKKAKDPINDREKFQAAEGYPEKKDDLPNDRFQDKKQTTPAESTTSIAADVTGQKAPSTASVVATVAKDIKKDVSIRPNADVEMLDGKQVGGVALAVPAQTRSFAGISDITTADDMSRTSYTSGGSRPESRFGKKVTVPNFIIDNTISEQIAPHFDELKNLSEDPDSEVGFNGNKKYTTARGKKNAGVLPQNLLMDRSIDIDHNAFVISTDGQILDNIQSTASYPTVTSNASLARSTNSSDGLPTGWYWLADNYKMQKSNYLLQSFKFTMKDGKLTNPHFVEARIGSHADVTTKQEANTNWVLDANNVMHSMIKVQTELGRETAEKWSPLGYVIYQPYQFNMLGHDMELSTGSIMAAAYKSAAYAQSYQINMLGKDGAQDVAPIFRAFLDSIEKEATSDKYSEYASQGFDVALFRNGRVYPHYAEGSAAAMIDMFDSTRKYKTKADIINQQRSLKFWLQSVDNNLNPLHCKTEFLKALDSVTMFSTEDGTYNPMLPVHVTDQVHLFLPLSLNFFLKGWTRPDVFDGTNTGTVDVYRYFYHDQRDSYEWTLRHPIVEGLLRWLLKHEGALSSVYPDGVEITWPCSFDMTTYNMFSYVMCAAAFDVSYMRNSTFRDILFAGEQTSYIWDDLASLKDLNPLHSSQCTYVDYASPLKLGKLNTSSIVREYWNETYFPRANTTGINSTDYLLPWMLSEAGSVQDPDDTSEFKDPKTPHMFNYPSRRSGVNNALFDVIYSMTPKDLLLSVDRPVRIPYEISTTVDTASGDAYYSADYDATKSHVKLAAARYDVQSDGRLVETLSDTGSLCYASIYEIPRQFGYIFPDVGIFNNIYGYEWTKNADGSLAKGNWKQLSISNIGMNSLLDARMYRHLDSYSAGGGLSISGIASGEIDRTAALQQSYRRCFAIRDPLVVQNANYVFEDYTCMIPCFSGLIAAAKTASTASVSTDDCKAQFVWKLGSASIAEDAVTSNKYVTTFSKYIWTAIQRYFLPVSPFEGCLDKSYSAAGGTPVETAVVDNMEIDSYFGFCGFKAADFNQYAYHRMNDMDQLNVSYVKDLFISDSMIFRDN